MPHSEVNRAFVLGIGSGFFVGAVVMWAVLTLADMARHFLRRRGTEQENGVRLRTSFRAGRIRFIRPDWEKPAKGDRPPFRRGATDLGSSDRPRDGLTLNAEYPMDRIILDAITANERRIVAAVLDVLEHRWPLSHIPVSLAGDKALQERVRKLRGRVHRGGPDVWYPVSEPQPAPVTPPPPKPVGPPLQDLREGQIPKPRKP